MKIFTSPNKKIMNYVYDIVECPLVQTIPFISCENVFIGNGLCTARHTALSN